MATTPAPGRHWMDSVYEVLISRGVDPHQMHPNYEDGPSRVVLALPESKVAICVEGDRAEGLAKDGWHVETLSVASMEVAAKAFSALSSVAFEHVRRLSSAAMMKSGSKEEESLLGALLAANLPEPNRNLSLRRPDNSELTVPDFAWEELRLAFFVDGLYWHVGKDDQARMKAVRAAASDKAATKALESAHASRAERDADNRSQMVVEGWTVLSCTDRDLATPAGVTRQVERITAMMRALLQRGPAVTAVPAQEGDDLLLEML